MRPVNLVAYSTCRIVRGPLSRSPLFGLEWMLWLYKPILWPWRFIGIAFTDEASSCAIITFRLHLIALFFSSSTGTTTSFGSICELSFSFFEFNLGASSACGFTGVFFWMVVLVAQNIKKGMGRIGWASFIGLGFGGKGIVSFPLLGSILGQIPGFGSPTSLDLTSI